MPSASEVGVGRGREAALRLVALGEAQRLPSRLIPADVPQLGHSHFAAFRAGVAAAALGTEFATGVSIYLGTLPLGASSTVALASPTS